VLMSTQDVVTRFVLHWSEHSKQRQEVATRHSLGNAVVIGFGLPGFDTLTLLLPRQNVVFSIDPLQPTD